MARTLQEVVAEVIERLPTSMRELARESGLSHVKILRASRGEGGLTEDEMDQMVKALRRISKRRENEASECAKLANLLDTFRRKRRRK